MDESEMTTEEKSWLFSEDVDDMSVKVEADSAAFPPVVSDVEVLPRKTEGDPVEIKDEANSVEVRADVKDLFSGSTPPPDLPRTRSTSPGVKHEGGVKDEDQSGIKQEEDTKPIGPILIDDLPTAWDEAHETFVTLEKCVYERKDMGLSRESDEMMVCDCSFDKRESSRRFVVVHLLSTRYIMGKERQDAVGGGWNGYTKSHISDFSVATETTRLWR